ncbi:hypothetical protein NHX12_022236 [Muraenolepis orangiensis]|uniref:Shieldin complex subunit 2 C-terminal domain-containing protein n=1 Tax=Muraenolepis orangiensis TaxID=630683 RepID=A0A9Q0ET59_9TELE|nr:hypothetical protein NHX12_022236 [Muraenolepis orangiensis]
MTDNKKKKIHVFLGAPPASTLQGECESGLEELAWPPAAPWSSVELSWQDGRLRPPAGELLEEQQRDEPTGRGPSQSLPPGQVCQPSADIAELCSKPADGPQNQGQDPSHAEESSCLRPGGRSRRDDESTADPEDLCVASLCDYLASCFPEAGSAPRAAPPAVSLQTQYLSTWTLSQALVLRARSRSQSAASPEKTPPPPHPARPPSTPQSSSTPELFSPAPSKTTPPSMATPPQLGSMDLFGWSVEESGVVLEATPDGVLCSQGGGPAEPGGPREGPGSDPTSPSTPPDKRLRRMNPECTGVTTSVAPLPGTRSLQGPTSLLAQCVEPGRTGPGRKYSVLVAAVHPCHLKEIRVKSGVWAGSSIPLATIVVTDQSGVEVKVVLWRRAAFWALAVFPGDILLITGLEVNHDTWRGETLLRSCYSSKLLNLGPLTTSTSPPAPRCVSGEALSALCAFVGEHRPLLASLSRRAPQSLDSLPYNAVLSVEQGDGQQGTLVLWGSSLAWLPRITRNTEAVWDFRVLLVRDNVTSDLPELHSTPWGVVQPVFPQDSRAREFCRSPGPPGNPELDLRTLLSQRYSGDVDLRVNIVSFQFQASISQNAPLALLDNEAPLEHILETLAGDVTYSGCGRCAFELGTDAHGIYLPCYPCLPHTSVRRYYRPVVLAVREGSSQVWSEIRHVGLVAERIQSLVSRPLKSFLLTVRSHFLCDENSVPLVQDFLLLDFQFLGE